MDEQALETIELEMAMLLRRATSASRKLGSLDRSAYLLLHQIHEHGPAGVKTLADEFGLDISTVSRQTASLEQKGYVTRMPDPIDGRAYLLQMTELGAKELRDYKQARSDLFHTLLAEWSDEDQRLFGQLLRKFNQTLL